VVLAQKQHEDQWSRIEDSDMNPCSYTYLIFEKSAQNIRWRKDSLFSKCCWENWISAWRKLKLDPCLSPCTSINSEWIKELNIRPETLKLARKSRTLEVRGISNEFLNKTQMAQQLRMD
jgi:hypothetical protein